jgi:hypothetical protein
MALEDKARNQIRSVMAEEWATTQRFCLNKNLSLTLLKLTELTRVVTAILNVISVQPQ